MFAGELLHLLSKRGVGLSTDGRTLTVNAPKPLSSFITTEIVRHRAVIIRALQLAGPGRDINLDHLMAAKGFWKRR